MERILIGQGSEHKVYIYPPDPKLVIKIPKPRALFSLMLAGQDASVLKAEFDYALKLVKGTNIHIPESRVVVLNKGKSYRILQRYIPEDLSIIDLKDYIAKFGTSLTCTPRGCTLESWISFMANLKRLIH